MKKRVFSGIQPTGNIHVGNYLAAIRRWADMQSEYDNIFCIVDLHAITVLQDPQILRVKNREVAALLFAETGGRIMGLGDPTKKMSKSDAADGNSIFLLDSPDAIRSKIIRAKTDSLREIRFDENHPGIQNLLTIYELFSKMSKDEIEARFEGKGYADFKQELAEVIIENLQPLQSRYRELSTDPAYIDRLLMDGCAKVQPIAEKTLSIVKEKIGLG